MRRQAREVTGGRRGSGSSTRKWLCLHIAVSIWPCKWRGDGGGGGAGPEHIGSLTPDCNGGLRVVTYRYCLTKPAGAIPNPKFTVDMSAFQVEQGMLDFGFDFDWFPRGLRNQPNGGLEPNLVRPFALTAFLLLSFWGVVGGYLAHSVL